jgi:hypothetical protein
MARIGASRVTRRRLLGAGATAGVAAALGPALPAFADTADVEIGRLPGVLAAPKPIPGGFDIPGIPRIHVHGPGPDTVVLPFSGGRLGGLDVDPSVITDFEGFSAVAFHVGSAVASDGRPYLLETDMRVMSGTYVAEDGTRRRGAFAFV